MRILVTGAGGIVGSALRAVLEGAGHEVVRWPTGDIEPDDYAAMDAFVVQSGAQLVYHLALASRPTGRENEGWLVNVHWPSELAWICRERGLGFVFTSSVLVFRFGGPEPGPFTLASPANETEGYGFEKAQAERQVLRQHPDARVVRLGWQIGTAPTGNNMLAWIADHLARRGHIPANPAWLPACSFVDDTAAMLAALPARDPGLYQFDSNRGWTFPAIVRALGRRHDADWDVVEVEGERFDQRMIDPRLQPPSLASRLTGLGPSVF